MNFAASGPAPLVHENMRVVNEPVESYTQVAMKTAKFMQKLTD